MCMYVADSCCSTVKSSTILQSNYPPIKKKWFRYVTLLLGHIFYQAVSKEEPNWQIWILTSFNFSCPGFGGSVNGQQNAKGKWPEEEQQPGHSASGKMKVHWRLLSFQRAEAAWFLNLEVLSLKCQVSDKRRVFLWQLRVLCKGHGLYGAVKYIDWGDYGGHLPLARC